ncbi:Carbapenem antibiotics biosynthesis protein carD [Capnocytophaga canis]|uniref:Carbapenem antibiotics biosynthesis protein carD n=1 Tax=Capnocytophaga canis TaxID=1848903 RepID=A0A0B7I4C6_9FLAO|nr:proline dehydrogenase family protein [Capnocytophaga canis]CEN42536.1 Carbapenem antibiotics biosynthesis protein carD [Capnocytophaga canis]CEN46515.1 Carbapenem antibiotics biosynthesis protein carD [Capnocytophaga canis]CEN53840.1 Carbapenem antibiotics biosynthesis protein carD [Capnocytophaga canis]
MATRFSDTQTAFALKDNFELGRAYWLFRFIGNNSLIGIGTTMTNLSLKLRLPVEWLIRKTVFNQFCGGVSEENCKPVIQKMYEKGVSSILDYSVEGKEDEASFEATFKKTMEIIDFVHENRKQGTPFAVFKPTGFGKIDIYQKISEKQQLTDEEQQAWERIVERFDQACGKAASYKLPIMIDAEESWMQDAADQLIEQMMQKYNKEEAIVYNTLQMYRHDRLDYLKGLHQRAIENGFYIGVKVVRGAYMEKENARAQEKGYISPICISKQATDDNYNSAIVYILEHIDRISLFAGTHNEKSTGLVMDLVEEKGLKHNDKRIWLAQLYGMSDHISFNAAKMGYNVAKYLPFGPVREVMPYLIRRAQENTSVAGQTGRELTLLKREYDRRKKQKK